MPSLEPGILPTEQDLGRRIDAVHQRIQLHLAEACAHDDPLVLIYALGYELLRRVQTLESIRTPKALDRFLVDFTRVLRRHVHHSTRREL